MFKKAFRWLDDYRFTPLILLVLTILSYGLFSRSMGFFMDDWYVIWFGKTFGAAQFPVYYALDRPFMGYFYVIASTLLGKSESPLVWQIFSLVLRWLCSYTLWGMLNAIWPEGKRQNTWVALLAAVFPGFTQQWIVVAFSSYFAGMILFFLSITVMIKAIRDPRKFWLFFSLSVILSAYEIASVEFFYGLELIRVVILWIIFSRNNIHFWPKVIKTLKYWASYLVVFVGFTIWRTFFYTSVNHELTILDALKSQPLTVLITSVQKVYQAAVDAVINSWAEIFNLSNYPSSGIMSWVILALILLVFTGVLLWIQATAKKDPITETSARWGKEAIWVSLIALIVAIIPFWAAGLAVNNQYPDNRFMLAYLPGSCLFIVAILELLSKEIRKTATILLVLLVAFGVGFQFTQGLHFRNIWKQQDALYWQLNWRMPAIEPGTTIMAWSFPNRDYYSQNALAAQLNWTYANSIATDRQIPYQFIFLGSNPMPEFQSLVPKQDFTIDFRTYEFKGNTSNSVLISYDAASCLRVLDSQLTPPQGVMDDYTKGIIDGAELSDLSLILPAGQTPNHPPLIVLGPEPTHTWCYYFEKAELARQEKDYSKTISLLDEAQGKGFSAVNDSEWFPFIDAYLHLGKIDQAKSLSQKVLDTHDTIYQFGMCNVWVNYSAEIGDATQKQAVDSYLKSMGCN
jgi:hypothetical protein